MKHLLFAATLSALLVAGNAYASDVISPQDANAFVQKQFADYFTDCQAFVDSFAVKFKYCDGAPCTSDRTELLNACLATQGSPNTVHSLTVVPSSTNPFNPSYEEVAIKGKQTVVLVLDPTQPPVPLCFDFVITEELQLKQSVIRSTEWIGYYTVGFGPCQ